MIKTPSNWKKAIPALMAGIAFFLISCHTLLPVKKEVESRALSRRFAVAEEYRKKAELNKALSAYKDYLEQAPAGINAAQAAHRTGEIYLQTGDYEKALIFLKKVVVKYPRYPELPTVEYLIAKCFLLKHEYRLSMDEALKWLEKYPGHPLVGDTCLLLGDNCRAIGDNFQAFKWWFKAEEELRHNIMKQGEIDEKLVELIKDMEFNELEQSEEFAAGTRYLQEIYYRAALILFEQDEPEKAKRVVTALLLSTTDQSWVFKARKLLEMIDSEMSVNKNAVGCLLPLSGIFSIYGEKVLNGIQLGIAVFDKTGPFSDIELVIRDTEGEPGSAQTELEDLVKNEKVIAVIGPILSKTALACAKKAKELGVPMIALSQKAGIVNEGDMVFRNFLTPAHEVDTTIDEVTGKMGLTRFAILYPDNSYGNFFMNLFWDGIEKKDCVVSAVESYDPDITDFSEQIKKMTGLYYPRPKSIKEKLKALHLKENEENEENEKNEDNEKKEEESGPIIDFDAVFIPDNYQRVAMIAPQLAYHDVTNVLLIGTSMWQSPELIDTARDYVQGAIFTSGFFEKSGNPGVQAFVRDYKTNFETTPEILAANGYDTIRLLIKVMKDKNIKTRKSFKKALLNCRGFEGVTGKIAFDSNGEVTKKPLLLTIHGNEMRLFH
ncbi:MAG: penicillin-binding protein activator [Deltaproteobacteria bacterium]|nr:penicillin-binding protein activator [Deltaproteobacteria bacterium]